MSLSLKAGTATRVARLTACLGLLLVCSCIVALTTNKSSELTAVDQTLRDFNTGLTRGDTARIRALVRADFRLIEDSVEYNLAGAVSAVSTAHAAGVLKRELSEIMIEQRGLTAWTSYRVHGSFVTGRDTLRFGRLESAILQRQGSRWAFVFMTSSPAPSRD